MLVYEGEVTWLGRRYKVQARAWEEMIRRAVETRLCEAPEAKTLDCGGHLGIFIERIDS